MNKCVILTINEILEKGIEFTGDVCYSGEWGQDVCNSPEEDGGKPITGIVYEKQKNGHIAYYSYYKDGILNGPTVTFYEDGKVNKYMDMFKGVLHGKEVEWFKSGKTKLCANRKYRFLISYKEWDEDGNLLKEKNAPTPEEYQLIKKYDKDEERWTKKGLQ